MPSLKEVRTRIASVNSTQQITNAMKMVSAAKLRRAHDAILRMRPYAAKLQELLQNLASSSGVSQENPFAAQRNPEKILIIVIASNRGLCGAFNSNVIKATVGLLKTTFAKPLQKGNVSLICIGKKASDYFLKNKYPVIGQYDEVFNQLTFDNASGIIQPVMDDFATGKYDKVLIIYNRFKNAATQVLETEQFLPIHILSEDEMDEVLHTDYIMEPSREEILEGLIPKSLRIHFFRTLLDSHASEHGARMTAMHKATDNATELLKELRLSYNKARQLAITKEILEIVSGAEALKG